MECNENIDTISELKLKYPPIVVEEAPEPTLNYDVNGPRLMIEKIENENFKSYSGTRTLGPFHKNFTAIIGPNGSGKSNVIDALLFVFGFRASKIRSKKLSVLIHKSELFPNIPSCSVRVFFQRIKPTGDGDQDYDVIPNSEFIVSRTAFKDNSSNYKINDKKANNKEVSEFLKKQGIDLDHNRFLILQGEVEQIALMKPKALTEYEDGLLEYLEDIIGSHRFKEPLEILFKRLEELCELRSEKLNRVKITGKEKKDLEGVRNEAVKYLRLCNEIVIRKNISFQLKIRDLKSIEETAIEKQNEVKQELEQLIQDIEKINILRTEKEKELKKTTKEHLMKVQQFDVSQKNFSSLEIEDAQLRDSRKHCKVKLDELTRLIKEKEREMIKYEKVPEESVPRIEQLAKEIEQLEQLKVKENENQEKAQIVLKEETKDLQQAKDSKTDELRKQQELLKKQESEILSQKCTLDLLKRTYQKEEDKFLKCESKLKTIRLKINEHKETIERLQEEVPKLKKDYENIINEIEKSKNLQREVRAEFDQLYFKLQSGQSKESGHKVIRFLLEEQKMGRLSGVVERLGNLASVNSTYDVAISTACNRLDSIVTENIDNAQKCVELMKVNNIPRSFFIGLDKVRKWESKANVPFPVIKNTDRAFDLLKIPNTNHKAVFYFVLKDLLISNNLDDASKVNGNGNRYKIVTLKGEIIEVSGAMTGGGSRIIKGKICTNSEKVHRSDKILINPQEVENILKEKEHQLNEINQKVNDLTTTLENIKRHLTNKLRENDNYKENLNNLYVEERELEKDFCSLEENIKKIKPDPVEIKKIEVRIEKLGQRYDRDSDGSDVVKAEIEKINEEIKCLGVAKLGCIKSRLNSVLEKIKEKSDILKKINLSVKNAEKISKRAAINLNENKDKKTKYENDFKHMDDTLKALESKAEETLKEYQQTSLEVDDLLKQKEEQVAALNVVLEDLKKNQEIQRQVTRDFDEKKCKVDQIKMNIRAQQDEIRKLKLYPLPEGSNEDMDDMSFMDLIGENGNDINIFSSQKDSHTGTQLKVYSDDELAAFRMHKITYQDIEDKLQKQKPNLAAIEEYRMKEEIYMHRAAELSEVTQLRDHQREQLEKLKRQRLQEFQAGFNLITGKLKEMYQMITMGGDAELELVDTLDPFSEGIVFSVRPPKKSWKNISNLSGGEKTLSSLALVFALHHFKPTPFYVMDEIDAALDFKNVSIVANYLKERTKNAQFIIISLRNNMYELADRLVGIFKPHNFTKTIVVNPNKLSIPSQSTQIQRKQNTDMDTDDYNSGPKLV